MILPNVMALKSIICMLLILKALLLAPVSSNPKLIMNISIWMEEESEIQHLSNIALGSIPQNAPLKMFLFY